MCEPATIAAAALALSAASAAATVKAKQDAADAQNASNERQRETTLATAANNNTQVNLQGQQTREQTLQKLAENNRNASIGIGKATAAGGVSGVEGNSVDALLGDLSGTQVRYNNSVQSNFDSSVSALENQRLNVYSNAANTINGLKSPAMPDYITAGLQIGDATLKYGSAMNSIPQPVQSDTGGAVARAYRTANGDN
jgi:hypothetical protein